MARLQSGERAKAAFDALVLGSEKGNLGFRGVPRILGESLPIKEVRDTIQKLSQINSPVLISGETGTGKELVARAIHALSPRAKSTFRGVNCAAFQETLLESEFFGHAAGAFTGATGEHKGFFQACRGGTLLLDEIGEMPLSLQAKLLRAIEDRCVQPLGSDSVVPTNVRLLAATNRDLRTEIDLGRFRADLFYRLEVHCVEIPPLRARGEDVLLLAKYFLGHFSKKPSNKVRGFSDSVAEQLLAYSWPGNVRELKNLMEKLVVRTCNATLGPEDLPQHLREGPGPGQKGNGSENLLSLSEVEHQHILHVLEKVGGNRSKAARILGLGRRTILRKLGDSGRTAPK